MAGLDERSAREVFIGHCRDLGHKASTVRTKLYQLARFFRYARELGIRDLREVTPAHIESFIEHERQAVSGRTGRPLGGGTLVSVFMSVRLLFAALYRAELVLSNPVRGISLKPKEKAHLRKSFTEEEIARFLDGIDIHLPLGLRDRAKFELM